MTDNVSSLRKLQEVEFISLLEFKRICDKHNLPYFLTGGTLLGAVRHQGFIPWDDDIDVAMLREHYDKFIQVCETELSSDFFLQTKESDKNCALPWAKLMLTGTKRKDKSTENVSVHQGIDMDIFPYDNLPDSEFMQWIHSNICMMLRGLYTIKCNYILLNRENSLTKKIGMGVCRFISIFLSKDTVSSLLDKYIQKYNKKTTKYVMNLAGTDAGYKKRRCLRGEVTKLTMLPFEGHMFSCPDNYDSFLTRGYGDYMQLPPEEERVQHVIIDLDFGKYK